MRGWFEVFVRFGRLGLTAFGGPVAHLGYFRREFVERAGWLDDREYGELVALCSALPGPTSSQVGIALGLRRAGPLGALLAWLAFTTPSAVALGAFALALRAAPERTLAAPWLRGAFGGLGGVAAAIVAIAVVRLGQSLTTTTATRAIAAGAAVVAFALAHTAPGLQWLPLALGGGAGLLACRRSVPPGEAPRAAISGIAGGVAFATLAAALVVLPVLGLRGGEAARAGVFFRAGSLVFGGGHVVLPYLQGLATPQHVPAPEFFAGYGAAQAVPGPLFTFAAFLGAADRAQPNPALGAIVATLAIFAPSFLLLTAAFPAWRRLRGHPSAGAVLAGCGAAVVGMLAATLVDPILTTLLHERGGLVIMALALAILSRTRAPAWLVAAGGAAVGAGFGAATRA